MRKRQYFYVVAYNHKYGLGSAKIWRKKKISTPADIHEVERSLELNGGVIDVGLTNIMLIGKFRRAYNE